MPEALNSAYDKFKAANDKFSVAELEAKYSVPHMSVGTINMSQLLIKERKQATRDAKQLEIESSLITDGIEYDRVEMSRTEKVVKIYYG